MENGVANAEPSTLNGEAGDPSERGPPGRRPSRVTFADSHEVILHSGPPSTSSSAGHEHGAGTRRRQRGCCSCCSPSRARLRALQRECLALHYAAQDQRTPLAAKLLPWLTLAYANSPLHVIPDCIPLLNRLDDLCILPALLWVSALLLPQQVMVDGRRRADVEPLLLSAKWAAAVTIFLGWTAAAVWCTHLLVQQYGDDEVREYEWAALAGTAGCAGVLFVTASVSHVAHEQRRRDEWNTALLAVPVLYDGEDEEQGEAFLG